MQPLLAGITWRRVAMTFVVSTVVVAIVKWPGHIENPFLDLLVSGQVVGFTIMLAVSVAGNLRIGRMPKPVVQLLSVVLGSLVGTVLVVLVKGRSLSGVLTEWEGFSRFSTTATLGMVFGGLVTAFFVFRERDTAAQAAVHRAEAEKNLIARRMAEAQLALMQAQVEPHFLFNALANVRYLAENDPPRAVQMLDHLIDYLKAALPQMRESVSTLGRETDLIRAYLSVQQIRMGDRLRFAFDIPDALLARAFPPSMAIMLVENAIRHGIEPCCDPADVAVSAGADGGVLRLTVADTGVGMKAEAGTGIGLANVRARLQELFGEHGRLVIETNVPRGVRATIEIPDH
jgi:sensor histidine kinase YesM